MYCCIISDCSCHLLMPMSAFRNILKIASKIKSLLHERASQINTQDKIQYKSNLFSYPHLHVPAWTICTYLILTSQYTKSIQYILPELIMWKTVNSRKNKYMTMASYPDQTHVIHSTCNETYIKSPEIKVKESSVSLLRLRLFTNIQEKHLRFLKIILS